MGRSIMESLDKARLRGKGAGFGLMALFMRGNGCKARNMGKERLPIPMVISIKENGPIIKDMVEGFLINFRRKRSLMVNFLNIGRMDSVKFGMLMEHIMKEMLLNV